MRKYVLIIPDGAADTNRERGGTPLKVARTPGMDFLAREGVSGLMQTLYEDLPRESLVAQLGMLGWDPRQHYPCGRASAELLALENIHLNPGDIAFRANLVKMNGPVLESYNAHYIKSPEAEVLIAMVCGGLSREFPELELYHHSDFRNTLVFRNARIDPRQLHCPEPHENHGRRFDLGRLISSSGHDAQRVVDRINAYLVAAAGILGGQTANALFPWSASRPLQLPSFRSISNIEGRVAIVGYMDFLKGITRAGGIDFIRAGNGRPDTDYDGKGRKVVELLESDCRCVVCHINGPDEASHMEDLDAKIRSLEKIDECIVQPILRFFERRPEEIGGVMIVPDHYSNIVRHEGEKKRSQIHSLDPVPFVLWNNSDRDACTEYHELAAVRGKYGATPVSHLQLWQILLNRRSERRVASGQV